MLKLIEKIKILDKLKFDKTIVSFTKRYKMNKSNVRKIRKNKDTLRCSVIESAYITIKT